MGSRAEVAEVAEPILATCSRIVFAMSRDSRFPGHHLMRRVNPRTQTPVPAAILIVVVGVS